MKKLCLTVLAFCLLPHVSAFAVRLKWEIPRGERLEIVRTALVRHLINDKLQKVYEERNIIDLTCYEKKENSSAVRGMFSVYQRESENDVFHLQKQYPSDFIITENGRYIVPKELYVPNLRHIPYFSGKETAKGDKWQGEAELILNNFSKPFKLVFPVEYQLDDVRKTDKGDIAVISYKFLIARDLPIGKYPADFPFKILCKDEGTVYWEYMKNRPESMNEKYRIIFYFPGMGNRAESAEFQMYFESAMKMYAAMTPEQKEREKQELKKNAPDGVDVDSEKRGLVLRLGDILFDFDSSALRNESRATLDKIIDILKKKYPDREIIVEGHTDNIGGPKYNKRLSMERARTVAEYLKSKSRSDKLSFRGLGADRPIAGNDSKEGRQKNRRVEIIIKLQ